MQFKVQRNMNFCRRSFLSIVYNQQFFTNNKNGFSIMSVGIFDRSYSQVC